MPEVQANAEVTLVTLVYRSLEWLDFVQKGVAQAKTDLRYRWLVVANDATPEVSADPRIDVDFRNDNPDEFYINRVYRAWNEGVRESLTDWVVLLNTDMWPSDGWLDVLWDYQDEYLPTSLLVESGKLPSGLPDYVKDFGRNPETFDAEGFSKHAEQLRVPQDRVRCGGLYMPVLFNRQQFFDLGAYPEGNPPGTTGDKDLFRRYEDAGIEHITALKSIVYHVQTGEQEWP